MGAKSQEEDIQELKNHKLLVKTETIDSNHIQFLDSNQNKIYKVSLLYKHGAKITRKMESERET